MLVVLELLDLAEKRLFGPDLAVTVELHLQDRPNALKDINKIWKKHKLNAKVISIRKNIKNKRLEVEVSFRSRKTDLYELITTEMNELEGLESFKIS
jgi:uncharacterized membrane protein YhiD involved in acid resistance